MDRRTDHDRPDDTLPHSTQKRGGTRVRHLWPWLLAGCALSVAMCVVALEAGRIMGAAGSNDPGNPEWWHSSTVLAVLISVLVLTASAVVVVHQRLAAAHGRDESQRRLNDVATALATMTQDPASAWRRLTDGGVVDGYALWDSHDRLIDAAGFLRRYIPHLGEWRHPTGRQVITTLADSGALALIPGTDRTGTIDAYWRAHRQTPGLCEFRMADGQVYMARGVDLGEGRRAGIFTNVSELRRPGNSLNGDDTCRQIFDQTPSAKLLLTPDLRPQAINRAGAALLGRSADELARLGWGGIVHPDEPADLAPWSPGIRRLMTAGGDTVRVEISSQPLPDDRTGEPNAILVALDDVTARWNSEERLRLQSAVLDHMGVAMLAIDRSGRVAYGNQAARTLFQWSDAILAGTPVERLLSASSRCIPDREVDEFETEGTTWGGAAFAAQVNAVRLGDGSPLSGGAVLQVTDLTQRRALDLQLMHSARLATLGEMAASIAHEFNQCLHIIRLAAEAVRMDLAEGRIDGERLGKRAEAILSQVDRLTEMVTHMRAISRRESQDKQPFPPQAAVDTALRMVEPLLKVDGIQVVRQGRLDGLAVLGHQVRLEQVLLNLLNNGRDAIRERFRLSGNSGGTITIACTVNPDRTRLRIAVRDDGTGIAAAVGEHIFEPFVTTKDGGQGLGLGLSISRGICTEMGGSLRFGNVAGGAEFVIELPAAAPGSGPPAQLTPAVAAIGADGGASDADDDPADERRVLLVDDEALSVLMVCEFLHRQGYVVDTAYDGLEAYELCQRHVYHVVITDIRMPRMNGHELIAKLEELQPGTPVIVVTGHLREDHAAALGANVVALLAKPFQLHDLRDHLLRLEPRAQERQEEGA